MSRHPAGGVPGGPGGGLEGSNSNLRQPSAMNSIDSSATRLLVATKALLERLTQWSRHESSDQDVSDAYVTLGNEFNIACRAFVDSGVSIDDFGDVPYALRIILEKALSEEPSQESLEKFLPRIREIIVDLLNKLKHKQQQLRLERQAQHNARAAKSSTRNHSGSNSNNSSSSSILPTSSPSNQQQPQPQPQQHQAPNIPRHYQQQATQHNRPPMIQLPPPPKEKKSYGDLTQGRESPSYSNYSGYSKTGMPTSTSPGLDQNSLSPDADPLSQLKKGEALERRASRRYSAYQYSKLASSTDSDQGSISSRKRTVPTQNSSTLPTRHSNTSSFPVYTSSTSVMPSTNMNEQPDVKEQTVEAPQNRQLAAVRGDVSLSPVVESPTVDRAFSGGPEPAKSMAGQKDQTTQPTPPVAIYLQFGRRTKKVLVDKADISIQTLRRLFMDKFTFSPGADAFPEICLLDLQTGIRYEIDEQTVDEVGAGSVVSLSVEAVDEVKRHIDDGLAVISRSLGELSTKVIDNSKSIETLSQLQIEQAKQLADHQAKSEQQLQQRSYFDRQRTHSSASNSRISGSASFHGNIPNSFINEVDSLRKDVAVIRQVSSSTIGGARNTIKELLSKLELMKSLPIASSGSGSVMDAEQKKVSNEVDCLVTNVDEIQDAVEALRKDVAQRGVRYSARQLGAVSKDIARATKQVEQMEEYILREKPFWNKSWEAELATIVQQQEFFLLQEDLISDLKKDIGSALETFQLVEECSIEKGRSGNPKMQPILPPPPESITEAKDDVLLEVQALQPNHERRVEAIERAERMRKKEMEIRNRSELHEELSDFVSESKLKKSGGVEETERRRHMREQEVLEEQRRTDADAKAIRKLERKKKKREKKDMPLPDEEEEFQLPEDDFDENYQEPSAVAAMSPVLDNDADSSYDDDFEDTLEEPGYR